MRGGGGLAECLGPPVLVSQASSRSEKTVSENKKRRIFNLHEMPLLLPSLYSLLTLLFFPTCKNSLKIATGTAPRRLDSLRQRPREGRPCGVIFGLTGRRSEDSQDATVEYEIFRP